MDLLKNRVAVITGGTGALGRAVSERFLEEGAKVAVPWIVEPEVPMFNQRMGNRFASSDIFLSKVDLADEKQIAKFVDDTVGKMSRIDILVNLVGGFWGFKTIAETTSEEWQAMFDINL